jgi:hypothetical protein
MRSPNFQGYPLTEIHGDSIFVTLRWRTPSRLRARDGVWKVSVIVSIILGVYGLIWGGLLRYDPLVLAALFLSWLVAVRVALNALTWRKRVVEFTPEWIRFPYKLEASKSLQRGLPHGFRIQPMMMLPQGQMGQQGQQLWPMMQSNFYLLLDHVEQSCLLAEVAGVKSAELLLKRLVSVSEIMKQRFDDQQRIDAQHGEEAPRGTFHTRRVAP